MNILKQKTVFDKSKIKIGEAVECTYHISSDTRHGLIEDISDDFIKILSLNSVALPVTDKITADNIKSKTVSLKFFSNKGE